MKEEGSGFNPSLNNIYMNTNNNNKEAKTGKEKLWTKRERDIHHQILQHLF